MWIQESKKPVAHWSIKKCLFASTQVSLNVKGVVYSTSILTVLLYRAECWSLTEHLLRKLRNFHHRCLRTMRRVNRQHTREYRTSNIDLMNRLSLKSIDTYICRQQLRLSDYVICMPWIRLPRNFLSSWVRSKSTSIHIWSLTLQKLEKSWNRARRMA